MGTYGVLVSGGSALHTVCGSMDDHRPWRDEVTTLCNRRVVPSNYFTDLADYRAAEGFAPEVQP